MTRLIGKIGAFIYVAAIIAVTVIFTIRDADSNLRREVVIEAGSDIRIEDFFNDCPIDARFVTDVSGINVDVPAVYKLRVFYGEAFEKDVILRIEDHTGPKGVAIPHTQFTRVKWPEASECVGYLYDLSGIATVEYQDGVPSFDKTGDYLVSVVVTDWYNNSTVIDVPFHVINDETGPVIRGVHDLECNGNPDEVDFYNGITVSDDYDEFPVMTVDDSQVNYEENGTYEVLYKAADFVGNVTVVKAEITITLPEEEEESDSGEGGGGDGGYYGNSSGDPYSLASNIMSGLWRGSDVETARAIFNWVHSHIYYQTVYGSQTYESAAYRGFSRRNGDCYVYYCCAKMLLDIAGIPNMMVKRYPVVTNGHYWNLVYLNGEWYHCDATVFRYHPGIFFMCTDDEISDSHHQFNGSLYPPRAGGSTEYLIEPDPTEETYPDATLDPNATTDPNDPNATAVPNDPNNTTDPNQTTDPNGTIDPAASDSSEPSESSSDAQSSESSEEQQPAEPPVTETETPTEPAAPDTNTQPDEGTGT